MTEIPATLIAAYEATEFRVLGPRPFTLRIGQPSPALRKVYAARRVASAGFVTAFNPFSRATPDDENRRAQEALRDRLAGLGLAVTAAIGVDPSGDWPGEDSLFVPGLTCDQARGIGIAFGQNATVWAGADATPRLILLR